jgi:glycosyltransferase involved in cell wall biosynthesis
LPAITTEHNPLIIHTDWSRAYGGQEIRILTELREMRKLGFRVALVVPADSELALRAKSECITVYPVPFSSKFDLNSWRQLFRIFKKIQPAVVNTHSSEDSWMAGCVARLCQVPLVIRTRHVLAPISSACSYNLFPQIIFTCSSSIAEQLSAQGVRPHRTVVLPTGIDEKRFQFSRENRQKVRLAYGIGEGEVLVGNVGFLRHYKGHRFIIKTAAAMPANYRFMIVGGGGGELPDLQALTRELGVEDRVIFTGHQEHPEEFFSAFDLCFFSSNEAEGVSQSLIQSLLNGLPVLACKIPSTMEPLSLIEDYRAVDYDDVPSACKGLVELAGLKWRDPERMSLQHRTITERYGLQRMVRILVETYAQFGITVR